VSDANPTVPGAEGYPGLGRVLVVIPTYNEADNIRLITERLRRAVPSVDILVADDNSPDGTGAIADDISAADDHVFVLHRPGKEGLGAAYVAGFAWAKNKGYDAVVEMDADGSHAPEELPKLLDALREADAVLGTRYIPGGSVHNWPLHRLLLSRGGNIYIRMALGMPFKDATGGYRAYRMAVLDAIDVATVASTGYSFQVELAWRTYRQGFRMAEVPITFTEREHGVSKMSGNIFKEQLLRVTTWGLQARKESLLSILGRKPRQGSTWP
jgi:dolichol-phosphate mannosyltransferase